MLAALTPAITAIFRLERVSLAPMSPGSVVGSATGGGATIEESKLDGDELIGFSVVISEAVVLLVDPCVGCNEAVLVLFVVDVLRDSDEELASTSKLLMKLAPLNPGLRREIEYFTHLKESITIIGSELLVAGRICMLRDFIEPPSKVKTGADVKLAGPSIGG